MIRHGIWHIEKHILGRDIHDSTGTSNLEDTQTGSRRKSRFFKACPRPRVGHARRETAWIAVMRRVLTLLLVSTLALSVPATERVADHKADVGDGHNNPHVSPPKKTPLRRPMVSVFATLTDVRGKVVPDTGEPQPPDSYTPPHPTLDTEQRARTDSLTAEVDRQRKRTEGAALALKLNPTAAPKMNVHADQAPSQGPEVVLIKRGCFLMGSPEDEKGRGKDEQRHRVCIKRNFKLAKHEVTFAEYDRFARRANRTLPDDEGTGRGPRPVINVSWEDASAYARWLSNETGHAFRLLTEAEWEYAARAGSYTARFWGNEPKQACRYANVRDKGHSCNDGHGYTAPVGSFEANAFGLKDMLGNVWEWTCSNYVKAYAGSERHCAEADSTLPRSLRGGSWDVTPRGVRSAGRGRLAATDRFSDVGFRLAQD
jgi:formylglycine-generating enzyme required for sulfatase activity